MRRGRLALTVALALVCVARPAAADAQQDAARHHVKRAEEAYRVSNYEEAAAEFKIAYRLAARPDLLFNIARCYEVMARLAEAIRYYQQYLDEKPLASDRRLVTARLASLRARLDRERKQSAPPPEARPAPPERGRWKPTAGWILAGTGAASLAAGIAFAVLARSKADEFTDGVSQGRTFRVLDEVDRLGRSYQTAQIVTLVVGGVLLAAGSGLLVWDRVERRSGQTRSVVASPALGPGQLGVVAHARF